jgi:hypothetical protein
MGLSMFYITVEWCQQSFLSTEDYTNAMKGLHMTRKYRSATFFVRRASRAVLWATLDQLERLAMAAEVIRKEQRTLLWTKEHTWNPEIPDRSTTPTRRQHITSPSIELTDFDATRTQGQDTTPAIAHSLFPPAINTRRPRNASDASLSPLDPLSTPPRPSNESSAPLLPQRPAQAHRYGETEGRTSSEAGRVSFDTPFIEHGQGSWLETESAVQSRQGYRRANSDPGLLPEFSGDMGQGGWGLRFDEGDLERGG